MKIIDSHCHIDKVDIKFFGGSVDSLLAQAKELYVNKFLCVCIDLENFPKILKLAQKHPNIYASVGIHPTNTPNKQENTILEKLIKLAKNNEVIAIGETGLDYFHNKPQTNWQINRFIQHILAAKKCNKPLIIHSRQAREDTLKILKENNAQNGVMHCFTDDWQSAKKSIDYGFFISLSGIITFKNVNKDLIEVAKKVPDDCLLVETDAPYLTPEPFRGKANSPAYTYYVAKKLAEIRQTTLEHIAQITTNNFNRLFLNE